MIHCPSCNAENPPGAKLCVKCGTELPKSAPVGSADARKAASAQAQPDRPLGTKVKDASQDAVDLIWLLIILFLIFFGFIGEATNWTFSFNDVLQPRMVEAPAPAPKPIRVAVRRHAVKRAPKPAPQPVLAEKKPAVYVSPETLFAMSKVKYDKDDYQGSFKLLKQALDVDPTYARAYFGLGYLYARFNMNDAAVRMYQMSLRFDPQNAQSVNNLAMMYRQAGNTADAEYLLKRAVELNGTSADFHHNLGEIYLDQNQYDAAAKELEAASQESPKDATVLNSLALAYEGLGNKDSALSTWDKVLQNAKDPSLVKQAQSHMEYLKAQS